MNVEKQYCTKNKNFYAPVGLKPLGWIFHTVGCAQPDPQVFRDKWDRALGVEAHSVVGQEKVIRCFPTNIRCDHVGSGSKGSGNARYIGAEMTEPKQIKYTSGARFTYAPEDLPAIKEHLEKAYENMVSLCAEDMTEYGLTVSKSTVMGHCEAHAYGYGTNHGDPMHILGVIGKSMDTFRADVKAKMIKDTNPYSQPTRTIYKTFPTQKGDDVKWLQFELNKHLTAKLDIDGACGPKTDTAIRAYQRKAGLVVDGKCGPATRKSLLK